MTPAVGYLALPHSLCGITSFAARVTGTRFTQEWVDKILADENYWDQNAFNDLMIRGAVFEPRRKDRLFMCASSSPCCAQHRRSPSH